MANVNEKDKALEDARKCIEKAYGKGSVMRLGERPHVDVDVILIDGVFVLVGGGLQRFL